MKVQISNGMFMSLIINMVYAKAIGLTQGTMAREVGNDIWLATIISAVQGALIMLLIVMIIRRMPDGDIVQQSERLLGKWFGKLISLLVFVFFLGAYGSIMATFVYHLRDYFLPEAPVVIFIIVAVLIGSYGIFFGIEVIARMALVGVFSILALNILLIMGSISEFDIRELLPTFQSGFVKTIWASRHNDTDWAMATMMAAIILPLVREKETWGKSGIAGIIYGGLFVVMWPILEVGVLSAEVTGQYIISCMQMARSAQIGLFVHRYEMIMVAFFAISNLTQIMIALLCGSVAAQKMIGIKDYRPMIIPVALIFGGFGFWFVFDHQRAMQLLETTWVTVGVSIAIFVPLVIWLVGLLFKKKLQQEN
mgnify:CR=1 FL=1